METMQLIQEQSFEKREFQRIGIETQVKIKTPEKDSFFLGWIQDISSGGFKLKADTSFNFKGILHNGDIVIFETYEDFFEIKGKGEVKWTSIDKQEVGIKFEDLDYKGKKILDSFLGIFS